MDAYEFDLLDPADKWEYFWEFGVYIDSIRVKNVDYFLFRHREMPNLYMELFLVDQATEKAIRMISGGEALVKYEFGNELKLKPPWE